MAMMTTDRERQRAQLLQDADGAILALVEIMHGNASPRANSDGSPRYRPKHSHAGEMARLQAAVGIFDRAGHRPVSYVQTTITPVPSDGYGNPDALRLALEAMEHRP